jgi:DNA repair protein RecN (Recombination protein N)
LSGPGIQPLASGTVCQAFMLRYLKISNLAIIDQVEVEFREGFNVVTGETGAGKSVLVGGLNLLLGGRFSPELIRTGEEEAHVEGLFEIPEGARFPKEFQSDLNKAGELVLSRRAFRGGRSRCSVNGNLAPLAVFGAVGRALVSIFGQHEHHVLLDPEEHLEILDQAGLLHDARTRTSEACALWNRARSDLAASSKKLEELERKEKENAEAIEELSTASLLPGEEEALTEERDLLRNAVQIREKAYEAHHALYSRSGSLIASLGDVKKMVEYLASANPRFSHLRDHVTEAVYQLEDVALELREIAEKFHADPGRLEPIEERLVLIRRLKRKYGKDLDGLISLTETMAREVGSLFEAKAAVKTSVTRVEKSKDEYLAAARNLSAGRRKAAEDLESAMNHELKELAMPHASFSVIFQQMGEDSPVSTGLEKVEFFLASNPGEASRPLAKIASGGELSRIMLALKALQSDSRGASTVIFDEVDAGIGGHTASAVGTRLTRVARAQQVLCVTHLHQIAALADHHLSVRKTVSGGRTRIEVKALDAEQRVEELTRMLGAPASSESVKEHVRGLMNQGIAEVTN